MPEYLAPGVYVEEISSGPRPIEGVSTSTAGFVGETERGPVTPTLITSWSSFTRWYGDYVDRVAGHQHIYLPYAVRGFFDNGGQRVFIARVVGPAAAAATGNLGNCAVRAIGEGLWGNNILIAVKRASVAVAATPTATWVRIQVAYFRDGVPNPFIDFTDPAQLANPARKEPDAFEDYDNLSTSPTDANFLQSVINANSFLIQLVPPVGVPNLVAFPGVQLANGADDPATLTEYIGDNADPLRRRGIRALAGIREVSLLAAPDEVVVGGLRDEVINSCEILKNRFAITSADANQSVIQNIRPPRDTTYGAFYYPWVRVYASHTPEGHILVPSTGHTTGIYARVDVERGVHKAPANEVVRGIVTRDLNNNQKPLEYTLDKSDHDILNPRGVNVIRDFRSDGRDLRVYGARTMSSDAMWKYVNVRRLFIFVEQSIDSGTQWVVFEPNDELTWSALRASVSSFLRTVWRNGALMGSTPEEAFFVKCDMTTMTQDDLDNGRLICQIGIAPVKPAEFVIFRIQQKTLEAVQA